MWVLTVVCFGFSWLGLVVLAGFMIKWCGWFWGWFGCLICVLVGGWVTAGVWMFSGLLLDVCVV